MDAGNTGASISGNTLDTTADGTVRVRATIANGTALGTDYTQDFTITINATFVPVTDISNVPTEATAGTALTLTGTIAPPNATHQSIAWSVADAGSTGATISDNTLNATAAGTVSVRAVITNGIAEGTDYTQEFSITVSLPFVAVTGINNVPTTTDAGTALTLTGTVTPNDATYQTIAWSVANPGTTGATISGSTLNTTAAGTVIVRATITNGTAQGTDYTQNFDIIVKGPMTIIIDIDPIVDNAPIIIINGGEISQSGSTAGKTLLLTVTGGPFESYEWSIDGIDITKSTSASSFTVDAEDARYNNLGTHTVRLVVYISGAPYSATVYVEIIE
jgi:endo-1,4-beta-xylanase